eukprot:COSAG02_NODE_1331_length_13215_cov_3.173058_8_plen_68_part_00
MVVVLTERSARLLTGRGSLPCPADFRPPVGLSRVMPGKGESSALVVAPKVQSDPVAEEEDSEVPITL